MLVPEKMLEQKKRLSESSIWKMLGAAYCDYGIDAWAKKEVPFYLTNNPFIARQYAQLTLSYFHDCLAPNAATPIDLSHPVTILDLGAGTGRFAYLFLKSLLPALNSPYLKKLTIRYVMTDISKSNIEFWRQHPYFESYVKEGILDFAYYHHVEERPLNLLHSKQVLFQEMENPLVVIANYFFDSLPQDLFRVEGHHLQEGRVTVSADVASRKKVDPKDPALIEHLRCRFDYYPIANMSDYYPAFPELNWILTAYTQKFDNTAFLFPIGAFQVIRHFAKMSQGRMLLLAGNRGVCTEQQVKEWGEPQLDRHGTFSLPVSDHALAMYFRHHKGAAFLTDQSDPFFVVMAAVLGGSGERFPQLNYAFEQYPGTFEPSDYWKIVTCCLEDVRIPPLEPMLLLLKMGNWDPANFHAFFSKIQQQLPFASCRMREALRKAIHKTWEQFYPISQEDGRFVMNLGVLLFEMKHYPEALLFFQRSLKITGDKAKTLTNMGACYLALKESEEALSCFRKAAALQK